MTYYVNWVQTDAIKKAIGQKDETVAKEEAEKGASAYYGIT